MVKLAHNLRIEDRLFLLREIGKSVRGKKEFYFIADYNDVMGLNTSESNLSERKYKAYVSLKRLGLISVTSEISRTDLDGENEDTVHIRCTLSDKGNMIYDRIKKNDSKLSTLLR